MRQTDRKGYLERSRVHSCKITRAEGRTPYVLERAWEMANLNLQLQQEAYDMMPGARGEGARDTFFSPRSPSGREIPQICFSPTSRGSLLLFFFGLRSHFPSLRLCHIARGVPARVGTWVGQLAGAIQELDCLGPRIGCDGGCRLRWESSLRVSRWCPLDRID